MDIEEMNEAVEDTTLDVEQLFEKLEGVKSFDRVGFETKLENLLHDVEEDEIEDLTDEEYEELLLLLLAANGRLDGILRKVDSPEQLDLIIDGMKDEVHDMLEDKLEYRLIQLNLDNIVDEIDQG